MKSFKSILASINKSIRDAVSGIFALKSLQREVERKAKRANQRLKQLELSDVAQSSAAYQHVQLKSYDQKPGYTQSGRFRRDVTQMTRQELLAENEELDKFLSTKTSKARGYKNALKQSYETYREKYGVDLSFDDYKKLFSSAASQTFGYAEVLKLSNQTGQKIGTVVEALQPAVEEQRGLNERLGHLNLIGRVQREIARREAAKANAKRFKKNRRK